MSRSVKKNAVVKNGGKELKQQANRKFRHSVKNAMRHSKEDLPQMKEVVDPYDITDSSYWPPKSDKKDYDKAKRK